MYDVRLQNNTVPLAALQEGFFILNLPAFILAFYSMVVFFFYDCITFKKV